MIKRHRNDGREDIFLDAPDKFHFSGESGLPGYHGQIKSEALGDAEEFVERAEVVKRYLSFGEVTFQMVDQFHLFLSERTMEHISLSLPVAQVDEKRAR